MEVTNKTVHITHKKLIETQLEQECTNTIEAVTEDGKVYVTKIEMENRHAEWMMEYIVTLASGDSLVVCAETPEQAIQRAKWKLD
jgi:hypothetical protein